MIAIKSASRSDFPDFSPSAFAQILHINSSYSSLLPYVHLFLLPVHHQTWHPPAATQPTKGILLTGGAAAAPTLVPTSLPVPSALPTALIHAKSFSESSGLLSVNSGKVLTNFFCYLLLLLGWFYHP